MRRTSRGRRDLPLSFSDVEGICAGWEAGAGVVVGALVGCVGCCEGAAVVFVVVALLVDEGSAGGVSGCVEGAAWLGEAIVVSIGLACRILNPRSGRADRMDSRRECSEVVWA